MVVRIPRQSVLSYTQWINRNAHKKLHIRRIPADDYILGADLCKYFSINDEELLRFLIRSDLVQAFLLPSGATMIHPDGFKSLLTKWSKSIAIGKTIVNPITKKELLLE